MTVMLKQTERERATLKEQLKYVIEENKYMKQILSETSPKRRSPFGDRYRPDSSNSPVIKSSAGNTPGFPFGMNRTSSTDSQKNTPALPNNAVTSGRISVRTPPSGGKMGTIPTNATSTPPCHQQHYKTPKSVPHPINFGDWNMEESPH
ncbi:uncharacterized protein LOC127858645 isoform X2 [Dreissena polymorpha]|uniref:uncharacterized protein LOC127858645 isoform X2 n=1 Tax=Dreissena polymorpha TaxID=45954 RepID=UPI0022642BF1|nr:uncharacterized protein LOC127858645 isoform X2 [Dreissena polymorpha]